LSEFVAFILRVVVPLGVKIEWLDVASAHPETNVFEETVILANAGIQVFRGFEEDRFPPARE
jgi:hypothetical protein